MFEFKRAHDLTQLGGKTAMLAWLQEASHLHCQSGCARDNMPLICQLKSGAAERQQIDAVMLVETLILVGEEQLEEPRIDVLLSRRQPPAPFRCGVGAQQSALAVEHRVRGLKILAERR